MSKFHLDPIFHAHRFSMEQFGISETSFSLCHQLVLNIPTVQHKAATRTLHPDWCEAILPSIHPSVCLSVCPCSSSPLISSSSFCSCYFLPFLFLLIQFSSTLLILKVFSPFNLFLFGYEFSLKADFRWIHLVGQERLNSK